jgi:hypothetical protein
LTDLRLARKWNRRNKRKEYAIAAFMGDNFSMAVFWFGADRPAPARVDAAKAMLSEWGN